LEKNSGREKHAGKGHDHKGWKRRECGTQPPARNRNPKNGLSMKSRKKEDDCNVQKWRLDSLLILKDEKGVNALPPCQNGVTEYWGFREESLKKIGPRKKHLGRKCGVGPKRGGGTSRFRWKKCNEKAMSLTITDAHLKSDFQEKKEVNEKLKTWEKLLRIQGKKL